MNTVCGIIPAAGQGRRMGRSKPALPIRGKPMLHHVAESLAASLDMVVIVVNEAARPIATPLAAHCQIVVNPRPDAEMIESIQLGIRHIEAAQTPAHPDAYLVCPADVATISAETIQACVAAFRREPTRIVIATHKGKRGHPLVIPRRLVSEVLSLPPAEGLNQIPRRHPAEVLEVPCEDAGVLRNVNTPTDYDELTR